MTGEGAGGPEDEYGHGKEGPAPATEASGLREESEFLVHTHMASWILVGSP